MKNLTLTIFTILFCLNSNIGWSADYQKGVDAYEKKDYATALKEWQPLAENKGIASYFYSKEDIIRAQHKLGEMYRQGIGVTRNETTAVKWYRLSAKQGFANAQYRMGIMYDKGIGVLQDYKTVVKWWKLAAEQGLAIAQYTLGNRYYTGKGVPKDDKTSAKWYRLAAEQGNAAAQSNLGSSYANGVGVLKDYVYAHMWLNIGAMNGYKGGALYRDIVAKKMTQSQLEKAQKLARECIRKKYKGC